MKTFEVYLSNTRILSKEFKHKIWGTYTDKSGKLINRTTGMKIQSEFKKKLSSQTLTISEILDAAENGYVIKPMSFKELHDITAKNIKFVELLYIDVDNNKELLTIKEAINICNLAKLPFNGIQKTISYSDELPKFRIIFGLETPLNKDEFAQKSEYLIKMLFQNKIDNCSFKSDQMYYGSSHKVTNRQHDEFLNLEDPDFYIDNYLKSIDNKHYKRIKDNLLKKYNFLNDIKSGIQSVSLYNIYSYTFPPTSTTSSLQEIDSFLPLVNNMDTFKNQHQIKHYLDKINEEISPTIYRFLNNEKMELNELFGILSNLRFFKSGEKLFFEIMEVNKSKYNSFDYKIYKLKEFIKNVKHPYPFSKFCNDHTIVINRSQHPTSKINLLTQLQIKGISTKMKLFRINNNEKSYSTIPEVRELTFNDINKVVEKDDKKVHVFLNETGMGKTTSTLLSNIWKKNFFFAALSHEKIKEMKTDLIENELYKEKLIYKSNTKFAVKTPEIPDKYLSKKSDVIKNWSLKLPGNFQIFEEFSNKLDDDFGRECKELINFKRHNYKKYKTFSTHHDLLNNLEKVKSTKELIIIDEDITSLLGVMNVTNLKDLDGLIKHTKKIINNKTIELKIRKKYDCIIERLEYIMSIPEKSTKRVSYPVDKELFTNLVISYKDDADSMLLNLINDVFFSKNLEGQILSVGNMKLDFGLTTIILSATASPEVYKSVFGEDNVVFHNYNEVKKFNTTYQYGTHSMSKQSLNRLHEKGLLKDLLIPAKDVDLVVTFKSGLNFDVKQYFSEKTEVRYFGPSSIGINEYSGKNICILGTPRPNTNQIKMLYTAITNDLDLTDDDLDLEYTEVEIGSFRGTGFKLYKNELLATLQKGIIKSQLQQALGRNRGLIDIGKEFETHIFTTFPIDDPSIILK